MIGDYQLIRRLEGHGREVFLATRDGEGRFVLALFDVATENTGELEPEVDLCGRIDHPNVTSPVEVFEHEGRQVFVFEGVAGASLARIMTHLSDRGEWLSDGAALAIGLGMCRGLAAAHTARDRSGKVVPLIHAQLGPPQIFASWSGEVKVLGMGLSTLFGLAQAADLPSSSSQRYAAPEVRASGTVTVRGNVYAAAAILWAMLAGREPPEQGLPPGLRAERPDLDKNLVSVIDKALNPLLVKRTVSCAELARAIERVSLADTQDLHRQLRMLETLDAGATIGPDSFPPAALSVAPPPNETPPQGSPPSDLAEPAEATEAQAPATELMSRAELIAAAERELSEGTARGEAGDDAPTTALMSRQELIEAAVREATAAAEALQAAELASSLEPSAAPAGDPPSEAVASPPTELPAQAPPPASSDPPAPEPPSSEPSPSEPSPSEPSPSEPSPSEPSSSEPSPSEPSPSEPAETAAGSAGASAPLAAGAEAIRPAASPRELRRRKPRRRGRVAARRVAAETAGPASFATLPVKIVAAPPRQRSWPKMGVVALTIALAFVVGFFAATECSTSVTPEPAVTEPFSSAHPMAPTTTATATAPATAAPIPFQPAPYPSATQDATMATATTGGGSGGNDAALEPDERSTTLWVETSQPDAYVYVSGTRHGPANVPLQVPCGVHSVRIGDHPLTRWMSKNQAFALPCGRRERLMLEPWYAGKASASAQPSAPDASQNP